MRSAPYLLERPAEWTSPVLFASPHSGSFYPEELLERSVLDALTLRSSEDAFVHRLFDAAKGQGALFLSAVYPRAWVDLNRNHDEMDPALIAGISTAGLNPRIASGLGVIPRVVAGGRNIYRGKLSQSEAVSRIARVWRPYHQVLKSLLDETHAKFGQAILVDCHSMPREALSSFRGRRQRPEIVIGDRYGASCDLEIVNAVETAFVDEGFRVSRNIPFAGAHILNSYGRPSRRQHALQIEIDRSIYMDETLVRPLPEFDDVKVRISRVVEKIADIGRLPEQLAAE